MKYLSIDIEATGLDEDCLIIEFAAIAFDSDKRELANQLSYHSFIKCPSFEELKPSLNQWVIDNNEGLINKACTQGIELEAFKADLENYLNSDLVKSYFSSPENRDLITLFGKSLNAIDLPFLNRDLGWEFMRKYFSHRQLDLSSMVYGLIDLGHLPIECASGSELMKYFGFGEVAHTALEDAVNTAKIYFEILNRFNNKN